MAFSGKVCGILEGWNIDFGGGALKQNHTVSGAVESCLFIYPLPLRWINLSGDLASICS